MKRKKIAVWALALGLAITPNMAMAAGTEENPHSVSTETELPDIAADDTNKDEDTAREEIMQIEEAETVEESWEGETEVDESCGGDREADEDICEEEDVDENWDGTCMTEDALPPTECWNTEDGWGEEMCGMEVPEESGNEADAAAEDGAASDENAAEQQTNHGTSGAENGSAHKADYAESRDNEIAGVYQTVGGTQLCASAGAENTSFLALDEDTEIYCYGYYTGVDGTKWYYVQCSQDGNVFTGFCSSENIK